MPSPTLVLITGLPGVGKSTLADRVATDLEAAVISHDVVMAGMRGFPSVWDAMEQLDHREFRTVGWTVMWNIASEELSRGRSIVLDGVARDPEVAGTRALAARLSLSSIVVLCNLEDPRVHRTRISGRTRGIPNWPELTWEDVERTRHNWTSPVDVDVVVDTGGPTARGASQVREAYLS